MWRVFGFPKSDTGALWKAVDKERFKTKKEAIEHMKTLPDDHVYKVDMEIDYDRSRSAFTLGRK